MTYNLFVFVKLHEFYLKSEGEVLSLYEQWKEWDSRFGAVYSIYESMELFLWEVKFN